ncbi:MAG: cell division protein FtsL [Burkholderiaceae bacterium]|nr:MAG: cell division protein FtsL [Burkholderiaceae bacterium]
MNRLNLNLVLLCALIICALLLVSAQQRARHVFVDLERAQQQQRQLEVQWNQLQLEQGTLTQHDRVEQTARQTLGMQNVTPAQTHYLPLETP